MTSADQRLKTHRDFNPNRIANVVKRHPTLPATCVRLGVRPRKLAFIVRQLHAKQPARYPSLDAILADVDAALSSMSKATFLRWRDDLDSDRVERAMRAEGELT